MLQKTTHFVKAAIMIFIAASGINANAQDWKTENKVNVLFGLNQILLHGFNVEGNFVHNRLIFDYSHGVSLDFNSSEVTSELRKQGVVVHMPWTTGCGIGYRLTEWINIRVEPKYHRFEFYYDNEPQNKSNLITAYNTFTLGVGLYGSYLPFKKTNNFMKGIIVSPSIRYWPTAYSTLKDNKFTYYNKNTDAVEEIKTVDPGLNLTPLILNVSIGYSYKIKKHKTIVTGG
jgi:hypothetical protein